MFENSLWHILGVIIAVCIMIVFPIVHSFEKQEQIVRLTVLFEVDMFLDEIKSKGYIDSGDYIGFKRKLDANGYAFDIALEHEKKIFVPVYDEVNDVRTFKKSVKVVSELYSDREIKKVLFVEDNNAINTYTMSRGDRFTVIVSSKTKTRADKLKEMFLNTEHKYSFYIRLGGLIQNEAY